jgi:hypothetical protein
MKLPNHWVVKNDFRLIRTWTATDDCGNTSTGSQVITVQDTEAPTLLGVPADVTVDCNNIPPVAGNISATDNCDDQVSITFEEIVNPGACAADQSIVRIWTATDNCGNSVSQSQQITVLDDEVPVFANIPQDITVECSDIPDPQTPTASDNCDNDVRISLDETNLPGACPQDYILIRTWTATDDCGNEATVSQTLIVQDTEAPVLVNVPQDVTIECDEVVPSDLPDATDNCDPNVQIVVTTTDLPGACPQEQVITRVFTATDACGNSATASQVVTLQDTEAPVISGVPGNQTTDCGMVPPVPNDITATDNCDPDVEIIF